MESDNKYPSFMIVAGEASGDDHAAPVVRALLARCPEAKIFGMGGSKLRAAGVETIVDSEKHASVMGATEIIGSLGGILKAFKQLQREAEIRKPTVAIMLDFPDFNMRLAKKLHRQGVKVMYFLAPQIWAWRHGRIKTIKKYFKKVANIFPFEETYYRARGMDAEYVGHPFLDRALPTETKNAFCERVGLNPSRPIVALLPGSRKSEIKMLLEILCKAAQIVSSKRPAVQFALPVAPNLDRKWLEQFIPKDLDIVLVDGQASSLLAVATLAVAASGTVTIEAAIAAVPLIVVYRLSPVSYRLGRWLIKGVKNFAMPNILAGEEIVRELLQDQVTPERVAEEMELILGNSSLQRNLSLKLSAVKNKLLAAKRSEIPAAVRVAEIALELAGYSNSEKPISARRQLKASGESI